MTEMKRVTVSLPDEIDKKVLELRKDDRFVRCSYSEIVRKLLEAGLASQALAPTDLFAKCDSEGR